MASGPQCRVRGVDAPIEALRTKMTGELAQSRDSRGNEGLRRMEEGRGEGAGGRAVE